MRFIFEEVAPGMKRVSAWRKAQVPENAGVHGTDLKTAVVKRKVALDTLRAIDLDWLQNGGFRAASFSNVCLKRPE